MGIGVGGLLAGAGSCGKLSGFRWGCQEGRGIGSACLERGSKRERLGCTEQRERSETYREMVSENDSKINNSLEIVAR